MLLDLQYFFAIQQRYKIAEPGVADQKLQPRPGAEHIARDCDRRNDPRLGVVPVIDYLLAFIDDAEASGLIDRGLTAALQDIKLSTMHLVDKVISSSISLL